MKIDYNLNKDEDNYTTTIKISGLKVKDFSKLQSVPTPSNVSFKQTSSNPNVENEVEMTIRNVEKYSNIPDDFRDYELTTFSQEYYVYKNHIFRDRFIIKLHRKTPERTLVWEIWIPCEIEESI